MKRNEVNKKSRSLNFFETIWISLWMEGFLILEEILF